MRELKIEYILDSQLPVRAIRGIDHPFCCTYRGRVNKCRGSGDLGDVSNISLCLYPQMTPGFHSYVSICLLLESTSNASLAPTPAPS